ncbi:hypothetical protein DFS33DRAFT_1288809 [Desarmillaria ectypa]|nr:hypothetical protein DFS33DRAFT_1288809 [Desarmillaria ectypa]
MDQHRYALSPPILSFLDNLLALILALTDPNAAFMDLFSSVSTWVCIQSSAVMGYILPMLRL